MHRPHSIHSSSGNVHIQSIVRSLLIDSSMTGGMWVVMLLLLLLAADAQEAQIDSTEYAALRVVRNGLEDLPGSTFFSTWDFTLDPCTAFRGVVCAMGDDEEDDDGNKHVVMLSLGSGFAGSPGLSGRLSSALGSLPFLRVLTLVPGSVKGSIPTELGALSRLEFLGISRNLLSGSIPESLSRLSRLQGVDLSNNRLTGAIPLGICRLPSLTTLILSSNEISGSIPAAVTSPLLRLSLDRNQISGSIPSQLPLASLVHLDLSRNSLSGSIGITALLFRLTFLDLSFNQLTGGIPPALFTLPDLSELLLQRNRFGGELAPAGVVRIARIDLSYNLITGQPSPLLATVRNLLLNNNKLTGGVPRELIAGMAAGDLQNLYLQHNFLTAIEGSSMVADSLPASCVFCVQYNCMPPPAQSSCPSKAGSEPTRPAYQCSDLDGDWD